MEKKTTQASTSDIFFEQQLADALKAIKAKETVIVYSHPKGGKTVFLHQLKEKLEHTKQYLPVMLTARRATDIREFIKKNTARILEEYDIFCGKNIYALSLMEADASVTSSDASESVKACVKTLLLFEHDHSAKPDSALEALFALPAAIAKEKKSLPVIMIDDADALDALKSEGIKSEGPSSGILDKMHSTDAQVVVLSSSMKREGEGKLIDLTSSSIEDTRRFTGSLALDEAALSALHNLTAGNVLYLSIFTKALRRGGARNADGINALAEEMLANELGLYFSEKMKQLSPKENLILNCMAEHDVNTPARISKILDYPQTAVRRFLAIMEEKGFVGLKERGVFEIHDQLFKKWLTIER